MKNLNKKINIILLCLLGQTVGVGLDSPRDTGGAGSAGDSRAGQPFAGAGSSTRSSWRHWLPRCLKGNSDSHPAAEEVVNPEAIECTFNEDGTSKTSTEDIHIQVYSALGGSMLFDQSIPRGTTAREILEQIGPDPEGVKRTLCHGPQLLSPHVPILKSPTPTEQLS